MRILWRNKLKQHISIAWMIGGILGHFGARIFLQGIPLKHLKLFTLFGLGIRVFDCIIKWYGFGRYCLVKSGWGCPSTTDTAWSKQSDPIWRIQIWKWLDRETFRYLSPTTVPLTCTCSCFSCFACSSCHKERSEKAMLGEAHSKGNKAAH